jgi:hypothetical protein
MAWSIIDRANSLHRYITKKNRRDAIAIPPVFLHNTHPTG